MYKIKWDKSLNGILLIASEDEPSIITSPRPVFYEELDLLGFNKFWDYPKSQEPLLWAVGRKYYYKGKLVAEAKGGNIFTTPKIVFTETQHLSLEPINIKKIVEKNREALFMLENEALDFIEHTYKIYKKKKYLFAVSYSGGKDSQVVLDLVTRVIPPDELTVIFSDTTMEISYTYENVEKTKEEYEKQYPGLKFYIAKPPKTAIEFWKEFGPPSRIHRWCCTVTKTAPFIRTIKTIFKKTFNENGKTKLVIFDGVRSEESPQRNNYQRLSIEAKHILQINAEVIRDWNTSEVFLYLYYRNLWINKGYRYGLNRIGCSVCPFASGWSEYIVHAIQKDFVDKYIKIIEDYINCLGIKESTKIREYITQGQWKKRAGGEGISDNDKHLELISKDNKLTGIIKSHSENFFEWIKVIGDVFYKHYSNNKIEGEIKIKNKIYQFSILKESKKEIVTIQTANDQIFESKIKRVLYKSTYCVKCGACEAECLNNALKVVPIIKIDNNLCTHCGNCLYFVERGCLVAKSLQMAESGRNMNMNKNNKSKLTGFGRYLTFGLRDKWLNEFLNNLDEWFIKNHLGNKQIESMKVWLLDAELITKDKLPTPIAINIKNIYLHHKNLAWEFIWTNLYYNSPICQFFIENIEWNDVKSIKEIIEKVAELNNSISERTIKSGLSSLFNTFESSPLGKELKIGVIEKKGKERYVKKIGTDNIHPLTVAYSLYKAAEYIGRRDFTVSELYSKGFNGGPYKLFGIAKDKLEKILRSLQEDKERILKVDLVADLDNIYLREDLSSLDIIKIAEVRINEV